jgi:hypothetical protein
MKYFKNYFKNKLQALWHIGHALFPNCRFFESRVETEDFDHKPQVGPEYVTGYKAHLVFSLKCAARHSVLAKYPFLEVEFK